MPPLENCRFDRKLFRSLIGNYWVDIVADFDEVIVRDSEGAAMAVYKLDKAFYLNNFNDVVAAKYFLKFFDGIVAEERKALEKQILQAQWHETGRQNAAKRKERYDRWTSKIKAIWRNIWG